MYIDEDISLCGESVKEIWLFWCSSSQDSYDSSAELLKNNGDGVSQSEYARVTGSLMFLMKCTLGEKSRRAAQVGLRILKKAQPYCWRAALF